MVIGAAPLLTGKELVGRLLPPVLFEHSDGACVDRHDAASPGLGCPLDALPIDEGRRAGDGDLAGVEVDIRPSEVEQFAATSARVGHELEEGEQPVLPSHGLEGSQLLGGRGRWPGMA